MGSAFFEDTPAWEAGLRVQEAENKWLLREMLAVLGASKSYARSLTNAGPFGASAFAGGDLGLGEGIGGMLGALAGAGAGALAAGMEGMGLVDDDDPGRHAYPTSSSAEANFAAALERIGTVAASTAEEEEMAAPMAAAIGAPLLHPIADALRAVGMLRESLGRRVTDRLVRNVQAFVDEDLGAVAAARERWVADRTACQRARAHYLSQSASRPAAQAQAAKDLAAAKESLEASRARLTLAQIALEGRRRFVLLESTRETARALQKFFDDAGAAMRGVDRDLAAMEEYEMASRAQAEMRMEQSARTLQEAFDGLAEDPFGVEPPAPTAHTTRGAGDGDGIGDGDAAGAARGGDDGDDDGRVGAERSTATTTATTTVTATASSASNPASSSGRSADASIRASLASGREALDASGRLGVGAIRKGWLNERNPGKFGGWTRRYFVLDGAGRFMVYGRRGGANNGAGTGTDAKPTPGVSSAQSAGLGVSAAPESRGHSRAASEIEIDDETFAALEADAEETQRRARAEAERRGGLVGAAGSVVRGIGTGLGAAWSFVKQGAAPDPNATGRGFELAEDAVPAVDLTLSCVKPGADAGDRSTAGRPFCFRVISPTASLLLQAESEAEAAAWVSDLQGTIAELISMGPRNPSFGNLGARGVSRGVGAAVAAAGGSSATAAAAAAAAAAVSELDPREVLAVAPGNDACADCGAADPDWASMNLCVVVCQRCAGAHRHLGAHVSKVRSLALDRDAWTRPALDLFLAVGNDRANDVWEAKRRVGTVAPKVLRLEAAIKDGLERGDERGYAGKEPEHPPPVASDCVSPEAILDAVREKYANRAHVRPGTVAMATMAAAAGRGDVVGVLTRLACASADPRDAEKVAGEKAEALLASISRGDDGAATTALLLSNGARVDAGEEEGETLPTVTAATRAGCALEGTTFGLLRFYAEAQGVMLTVPPAATEMNVGNEANEKDDNGEDEDEKAEAGEVKRADAVGEAGEAEAEKAEKAEAGEVEKTEVEDARDDEGDDDNDDDDDAWIEGDDE